MSSIFCH
ncbi:hypothetical protein LINPERHAP1_LOCUS24149 [Linum perenne]